MCSSDLFLPNICKYWEGNAEKEILEIFEKLDRDHNNYIGYEEFISAAVDKSIFLDEKVLRFAFKYFDKNDTGEITYQSLSSIFKEQIKDPNIDESLKKVMEEVDKDSDGKIGYEDFCELMRKIL